MKTSTARSACTRLRCAVAIATLVFSGGPARSVEAAYEIYVVAGVTGAGPSSRAASRHRSRPAKNISMRPAESRVGPSYFVMLDDQTNPAQAVQLDNQLIAKRVPAFIGPVIAGPCCAVMPLLTNGSVAYCLSNAVHPPNGSKVFSSQLSTKDFAFAPFRYLLSTGVRINRHLDLNGCHGARRRANALDDLK